MNRELSNKLDFKVIRDKASKFFLNYNNFLKLFFSKNVVNTLVFNIKR